MTWGAAFGVVGVGGRLAVLLHLQMGGSGVRNASLRSALRGWCADVGCCILLAKMGMRFQAKKTPLFGGPLLSEDGTI